MRSKEGCGFPSYLSELTRSDEDARFQAALQFGGDFTSPSQRSPIDILGVAVQLQLQWELSCGI